ncbi:MAG: hypothetical protein H6563_09670 [Lewinellaceae bacterium]|nr:hypothetical protein [Lewinellaceae bacterium]
MKKEQINQLRTYLENGETEKAINSLLNELNTIKNRKRREEIVALSANFRNYSSDLVKGILSYEQQTIGISKINDSIARIIEDLLRDDFQIDKRRGKGPFLRPTLRLMALAIIFIFAAVFLSKYRFVPKEGNHFEIESRFKPIFGQVLDSNTRNPIEQVKVEFYLNEKKIILQTDKNGYFQFECPMEQETASFNLTRDGFITVLEVKKVLDQDSISFTLDKVQLDTITIKTADDIPFKNIQIDK